MWQILVAARGRAGLGPRPGSPVTSLIFGLPFWFLISLCGFFFQISSLVLWFCAFSFDFLFRNIIVLLSKACITNMAN
jgi:hypothetical protein